MATTSTTTKASQSSDSYKVPDLLKFTEAKDFITKLISVMDDQEKELRNNRHLRYTEIDIEAERLATRLQPDEMYVPQHIIDTNIRREQSTYVAYLTQSARSVVLTNLSDITKGAELIEKDFTNRSRYDGWQFPLFRAIDGMQQNGYSIVELVFDETKPGHMALQDVAYGDFGYSLDSKNLQSCEMVCRRYHLTKTQLLALTKSEEEGGWGFTQAEVEKVVTIKDNIADYKEQSLYRVEKVMFRKKGVVQVAWSSERCDEWLRAPKPLSIGRKKGTEDIYETQYPYYLMPYLITENTTIQQFKGRTYLDQDYQEGVSSLMSSFVTAHRRASYMMFSKDSETDPNAGDAVTTSNIVPKSGAVINSKVRQFQLSAPDSTMLSAIQALATANMQENSQINYAAQNRQDSRKTATEIQAATQSQQQLSTVQLALFSSSLKAIYSTFFDVVRSRVLAGLIVVNNEKVKADYADEYLIKPAGDTDVVERLQKIQAMQTAWPVMQNTPAAPLFLSKMLALLFPDDAPQYQAAIMQGDAKTAALATALQVLTAIVQDPNALTPEAKQQDEPQLLQLIQQLTSLLNPQQQKGQNAPPS